MPLPSQLTVQFDDIAMFVGKDRKTFVRNIQKGDKLNTHFGEIYYNNVVGMDYGSQVETHLGHSMYILSPTLEDVVFHLKRETQIIYPKDLGRIIMRMGIREGYRVIEAGSGSGILTSLLGLFVGDSGHVYTYERRKNKQNRAFKNVRRMGLEHRVTFHHQDIRHGFAEENVHAVFLDVPDVHTYMDAARSALANGGFFGAIVPTVNQMIQLLEVLYEGSWFLLQAEEALVREWKTLPARVRPYDDMNAHTGFLVFARAVDRVPDNERQNYAADVAIARQKALDESEGDVLSDDE